jgi:hypothetical protein
MSEVWLESKTLPRRYMVSSEGRVKRMAQSLVNSSGITKSLSERVMGKQSSDDYPRLILKIGGKAKAYLIHRLVAEMFVPNPHGYPCINHKDGNKANPHPDNLEWCTHQQNMQHAMDTGLNSCKVAVQSSKGGFGFWYPSLEVAKDHSGVSKPCICAAAKKRQATAGRMVWDYAPAKGVYFADLLGEVAA